MIRIIKDGNIVVELDRKQVSSNTVFPDAAAKDAMLQKFDAVKTATAALEKGLVESRKTAQEKRKIRRGGKSGTTAGPAATEKVELGKLAAALKAAIGTNSTGLIKYLDDYGCALINAGCFAAGTKLWTPEGYRNVEDFQEGDLLFSRNEFDPAGLIEAKPIEKVFRRFTEILTLHVGGQVIRTTAEHPFYAYDKGWKAAADLLAGEWILTAAGDWKQVEELFATGEMEVVYNLRVADWHTYFVGDEGWGWAAWAHNTYVEVDKGEYKTGKMFLWTVGSYSATWFVPKAFLHGPAPNQAAKDAVVRDIQGFGNTLQAKVNSLRTDWNGLNQLGRYGSQAALANILRLLNTVNELRVASGGTTINLNDYDNPSMPEPPATPNPQPGLGAAWAAFNTQRAIVRGQVLHEQVKKWIELTQSSASYHTTGPDVDEYNGTIRTWYEIYPAGGGNRARHVNRPGMASDPWREILYDNGR